MNVILLAGGAGKRLYPLSNEVMSKQFLKLFKNEDNEYESIIQKMYKNLCKIDRKINLTIATSESQVDIAKKQLGEDIDFSIEPARRDTFPAIALASVYLNEIKKVDKNEIVIVCPVDSFVDEKYFEALKKLEEVALLGNSNIFLMGIKPTYPSEKYGYIIPATQSEVSKVKEFKEKPSVEIAKKYIENNALWNGGIFAFKLDYILNKSHELIDFNNYQDLYNKYENLKSISFDYAVVEKESNIGVMRFSGKWEDLGSWETLAKEL